MGTGNVCSPRCLPILKQNSLNWYVDARFSGVTPESMFVFERTFLVVPVFVSASSATIASAQCVIALPADTLSSKIDTNLSLKVLQTGVQKLNNKQKMLFSEQVSTKSKNIETTSVASRY